MARLDWEKAGRRDQQPRAASMPNDRARKPVTEKQREALWKLATALGEPVPNVTNRRAASARIELLIAKLNKRNKRGGATR